MPFKLLLALGLGVISLTTQAAASIIAVGSDGTGPVQLFAPDGSLTGTFGPDDGTATAPNGSGGLFVAEPGAESSTIGDYNAAQDLLSSFDFTAPGDNNPYAAYVIDMTWGASGTIWLTTYDGEVYNLSSTGQILSSFSTGVTAPGIAFDGTYLYTDSGPGFDSLLGVAPFIYQMDTSGDILNTIDTGLTDTLGLSIDSSGFWVGGFDVLSEVDTDGNLLNQFAIPGTHYGVEETDILTSTPEPSALVLIVIGIVGFALWRKQPFRRFAAVAGARLVCCAAVVISLGSARAAVQITSVTPSLSSPQPVGTSVTFTVLASDTDAGLIRYQYSVRPSGTNAFAILSDFSPADTITWTPSVSEGSFDIQVTVLNRSTKSTQSQIVTYEISPRVSGAAAVVNSTNNTLVALYSAPPCPPGSSMRVRFKLPSDITWQSTPLNACNGSASMNFYVAGLRAQSAYQLLDDVITGPHIVSSPVLTFNTGSLPQGLSAATALKALQAPSSTTEPVTVFTGLNVAGYQPFAVDANLNVIWYASTDDVYMTRVVPGGGYLAVYGFTQDLPNSGLRQYDVAGNLVKETNVERMNDQLAALGMNPITTFHHEIRELANGNYLVLGQTERDNTAQGAGVDVAGDMILVLDSNLQLLWAWDSFDHLDVSRLAILQEKCENGPANCVLFNASVANDWTHGNSLALAPDGNLLYSSRHQDFVYKIAYQNGVGNGDVIWRLGKDGDFIWNSNDPWPWFSHQHDADYSLSTTISLFDDGNTRVQAEGGGDSRGQALLVNETNMTVNFAVNVDVGSYSFALGSAQRLLNGNYVFDSGYISPGTQATEWNPSGTLVSNIGVDATTYRTFRLTSLLAASY